MTQRLPNPGADSGDWGDILNSFLGVSLDSDGTLNSNTVGTNQLQSNAVTNAQLDTPTQTTLTAVAGAAQKANNLSDLTSADTARTNLGLGTAATVSSTLAGDLSGTLPNPTIAKIQGTTISSPSGGTTSYLNASGTWTTPSLGNGGSSNASSIDGVTVTGTPAANQVLTTTSPSAANWQPLPTFYQVQSDTSNQVALGANATYTGQVLNPNGSGFNVVVRATSDQAGILSVQDSTDSSTWRTIASQATTPAGSLQSAFFSAVTLNPYARLIYINGSTAQTSFEIVRQLIF